MASPLIGVVEDDEATLDIIDSLLTRAGYRTLLWPSGKDAHVMIRNQKPDLVILDLWLEDREAGGMVLGLMELDPATKRIPVLICSANVVALRDRKARLTEKGYAVVEKPFDPDVLLAQVAALLASPRR